MASTHGLNKQLLLAATTAHATAVTVDTIMCGDDETPVVHGHPTLRVDGILLSATGADETVVDVIIAATQF